MKRLPTWLALCVTAGGLVHVALWMAGAGPLTAWVHDAATQKASSAFAFVCLGWATYAMLTLREHQSGFMVAMTASGFTGLCMSEVLVRGAGAVTAVPLSAGDTAVQSLAPGVPSLCSAVAFIASALVIFARVARVRAACTVLALVPLLTGLVGAIGYLCGEPAMTCWLATVSSAMAVPTVLMFIALGLAQLVAASRPRGGAVPMAAHHRVRTHLLPSSSETVSCPS